MSERATGLKKSVEQAQWAATDPGAWASARGRKINVLFILPTYLSTKPGVDAFWLETAGLAQAIDGLVQRCDVLTPYGLFAPGELKDFATKRAAPGTLRQGLHRLPQVIRVLLGDARSWWRAQELRRRAVTVARENSYQLVIQVHRRFHKAGQTAAKESGAPFVLKMVALEVQEEEGWGIHRPWGPMVERFGELNIVKHADVVVPVSVELDESLSLKGVPQSKRVVLDNAVDLELFTPAGEGVEPRPRELGTQIVAGWVGGFQPFHGLHLLPDVTARLAIDSPDVMVCLVGDGPQFQAVAESLEGRSNVLLVGSVPHEEVPKWIRSFDMAFLLAGEGAFHYSPLKLYEYLASGCPVVAGSVGEIAQVIQGERGGLLVPPGDADATAAAIGRLAHDPDLRRRMALEGRRVAEDGGSWRTRAETLLSSLEDRGLL